MTHRTRTNRSTPTSRLLWTIVLLLSISLVGALACESKKEDDSGGEESAESAEGAEGEEGEGKGEGDDGEKADDDGEKADDDDDGGEAVKTASASLGKAAEPKPVGSADEARKLLEKGAGEIDTQTALRMAAGDHPQKLVLSPAPLKESGLVDAILGALPKQYQAIYKGMLAGAGDIDPFEALKLALFWSDDDSLKVGGGPPKNFQLLAVVEGDALKKAIEMVGELDSSDDDDDSKMGKLEEASLDKLFTQLEEKQKKEDADRPIEKIELAAGTRLMVTKGDAGGTNWVYGWPGGVAMGSTAKESEKLADAGIEDAAKWVSMVEAARAGSGGEIAEGLVIDAAFNVDGNDVGGSLTVTDKLTAVVMVPKALMGPKQQQKQQLAMFDKFTSMSEAELKKGLSRNVPPPMLDVAVLAAKNLDIKQDDKSVTFTLNPGVEALKEALPKAQ